MAEPFTIGSVLVLTDLDRMRFRREKMKKGPSGFRETFETESDGDIIFSDNLENYRMNRRLYGQILYAMWQRAS
jgi:hypothetical protein